MSRRPSCLMATPQAAAQKLKRDAGTLPAVVHFPRVSGASREQDGRRRD
jgi:hypothetical protein